MVLLGLVGFLSSIASPIITPYQSREVLSARTIRPIQTEVIQYEPTDFDIGLKATFDNPFDSNDVSVQVQIQEPDGKSFTLPAYFDMECERALKAGKEVITKRGKGRWRAKVSFRKLGKHRVGATVKDRSGSSLTDECEVNVKPATKSGFASVSEKDRRFFQTSEGKSFFPLGANVCWGGDEGTYNFDKWIPKYAAQGCNYFRVWLSPHWTTFGVEQPGLSKDGKGLGQFSLENLWRLDSVLKLARKYDMKV